MTDLSPWSACPYPSRQVLVGHYTRLEPLDAEQHGPALWMALQGDEAIWTYMAYGPFADRSDFMAWLAEQARQNDPMSFAVIDRRDGQALGRVAFMAIRPEHGVIETGHIFFSKALQRSRIATEAIFLQFEHAFSLGYRRFEWKCDARNEASRRAALRFGFTFEGIFRQHMMVKGKNRDTAWFALLDHEWPARRAAFCRWLDEDNFDLHGNQRKKMNDFVNLQKD
jgi:RimJ/RimL family protein N-acetyltransferase